MKSTYALLVTGLAAQQAAATWNFFDNFGTPDYSNNVCDDKQKGGFNWADLIDGQDVGNYGDFDFSGGWKCSNSFGKRDSLSKRTFGNKCIKNTIQKNKPAAFGCAQRGFSITHMDVSAEFDAELELHYKMGDGSICKQHSSCSAGGSTLQNTQCGGAKSVEVYLGSHYKGDKESCEIGFHNIGFDCDAEKPYTPPSPPSPPPPPEVPASSEVQSSTIAIESSTAPASSAVSSAVETTAYSAIETTVISSAVETPASSSAVETPATSANECGQYGGEGCPPAETPASSGAPYTNSSMPAYTPPASSAVEITSYPASVPSISTATPQPESSTVVVPPTSESSAAAGCGYGESCEQSSTVVASSAVVSSAAVSSAVVTSAVPATSSAAPQPSSPSYPPVDITDSVPKCMNSWLQISAPDCKDNTDSNCYCLKPEFTKNVIDCISARCGSDDEISKGLQYFIGICAQHVPENPSIVGDCPSYIPLNPTPAAPSAPPAPPAGGESSAAPSAPASSAYGPGYPDETPAASTTTAAGETPVITTAVSSATMTEIVGTTTAAGETPAGETPCTTITFGTTTLTVPQVHFTTQPASAGANPTEPVALVPGTAEPPQTPAATTPAGGAPYPIPSTMGTATVPMGTATGTGAIRPSSPAEFTGAASPFNVVPKGALFGAALALFAL
ncbi:hypothetical protein J4E93_006616 [Alternaria ventricosa]|uniref:uncharacterized protein n=1 Tax=Alternaria ventricosa TaxID=1187951 RepID=UPI0020C24178|nr:uncharacterized protein J4E93_006616 [Alternaria ventricosa]KAI4643605.1 hypothetical protein J4E93_006616 [Alternaria ventricosa]